MLSTKVEIKGILCNEVTCNFVCCPGLQTPKQSTRMAFDVLLSKINTNVTVNELCCDITMGCYPKLPPRSSS